MWNAKIVSINIQMKLRNIWCGRFLWRIITIGDIIVMYHLAKVVLRHTEMNCNYFHSCKIIKVIHMCVWCMMLLLVDSYTYQTFIEDNNVHSEEPLPLQLPEDSNLHARQFFNMLSVTNNPLYPGCKTYTQMSIIGRLTNLKSDFHIPERLYDEFCHIIKKAFYQNQIQWQPGFMIRRSK